jgi:hypothetical protein
MTRLVCAVLLTVTACSGGSAQKRPTPIAETGSGRAVEPRGSDTPPPAAPTTAECDALVAHVVQLARTEQPTATTDDAAQATKRLDPFTTECRDQSAVQVRCATTAPSLAEVAACEQR